MLRKSTFREIRTSLSRYLAIFAIVALGVGFFSGLKDCKASMLSTARRYLSEHNFYDYQITTSYGADEESVEIARKKQGVTGAEGSVQIDVMAGIENRDTVAMKAISMPRDINTLMLDEGRLPEKADECAVDDYSATDEGFKIGDTIKLAEDNDKDTLEEFKTREFKIVGKVSTPIYLDYQRGSTDIGNGSLDSFFFIPEEAFDVDYYTNLYLTLDAEGDDFSDELEDNLKSAKDEMKALAEDVNKARRDSVKKEAQDELDDKKKEYEEKLTEYESEKADALKKIADARAELSDAERKVDANEAKLDSAVRKLNDGIGKAEEGLKKIDGGITKANKAVKDLEEKRKTADEGRSEAEKKNAELEQAYAAGLIDEETYKVGTAETDAAIKEIDENIPKIDAGIKEADKGLKELEAKKIETEKTISDLESKLEEAEEGREEIAAARRKIAAGRAEINSEEAEAYEEFAKAESELEDAREKIDDAQKKIDEMETGSAFALSRLDNTGYSSFASNSNIVSNIAKVFPVFFFLIAALVCMTTMTRMIDEQRGQIGILKALGYGNGVIAAKYMFYSGSAALLGALTGFFIGCKVFPVVIWNAYTMMYDFSDTVDYVISPSLALISLAVAMICSMGATWISIRQDFKVAPSQLIRPKTPPAGKRILLEYIRPLWSKISFLYKVSMRNIFRDKKRMLMMVIGVSGCTALLIAGFGIRTSIAKIADYQYDEISLYDFVSIFRKDMTAERQDEFVRHMKESGVDKDDVLFLHQAEVTAEMSSGSEDLTCTAANPEGFEKFINLHRKGEKVDFPSEGEAVIVSKVNHDYGVQPGDEITLRDGFREMKVKVSDVCDNYVHDYIYISLDTYEKGFGKKPEIKTAMISLPGKADEKTIRKAASRAASYDHSVAVSANMDVKENVSKMMKSLDSVVYVVILSAALLAFIVLYNLTNINITERLREIATIKVLGFNYAEILLYVFRENFFLTAMASVVGIPLGKWLLKFVIDNIVVKMVYFEPKLTNSDILMSVILTFVFAFMVNLVMLKRLADISMTESLKSVE